MDLKAAQRAEKQAWSDWKRAETELENAWIELGIAVLRRDPSGVEDAVTALRVAIRAARDSETRSSDAAAKRRQARAERDAELVRRR